MENVSTICTNFGRVPCGQKTVETVKIENKTKKTQCLTVKRYTSEVEEPENLCIHPLQVVVSPKQIARFNLSYTANVEDLTENFRYNILDAEECIARLNVHAESVGPCLSPQTFNLKFFYLRGITQISKNIEIANKEDCEAKFYFDIDEDDKEIEISQRYGTLNASHKLVLKIGFKPHDYGVYYKKIFCLVQYHKPIVFNILGVYQPKLKIEPKTLEFFYPPELYSSTGYEAYMERGRMEKIPDADKILFFQKRFEKENATFEANVQAFCPQEERQIEKKHWSEIVSTEVFLTATYVDVKNSPDVSSATALVNISEKRSYQFSWNHDPCDHFLIEPCQGLLEPKSKLCFNVNFTPSVLDSLYHAELNVEILPCVEPNAAIAYLPLTIPLRIIGNSFNDKCHWLAQCRITPETLHLSSCVPNETVYGTFMIERKGHLPFTFEILPMKEPNFTVQPTLGYLSKTFQLLVVEFSSEGKEAGIYEEDLKIRFNDSDLNIETLKIVCSVEKPMVSFGKCNSYNFETVFPGSKLSEKISIENPTNLQLSYKFEVPEDITWTEIVNPTGVINSKSFGEVEVIFKPEAPCEYLDYIPCYVSSTTKTDYIETIHLQLIGSCQFGYLIASPSHLNFEEIFYKETKTLKAVLYNFSMVNVYFRLTPHGSFGNAERDVKITPNSGCMPPKGSLEVEITVTSYESEFFQYEINCQNFNNDSDEAQPCEEPRPIILLQFKGVLPTFQITDICFDNGGPIFSPDWAWKMFCVDRINAALRSVNPADDIQVTLPEGMKDFGPLSIYILMEGSKFVDIPCESKVNVSCPCASCSKLTEVDPSGSAQCKHKKAVVLKQFEKKPDVGRFFVFRRYPERVLEPPKQLLLQLKLNYNQQVDLNIELSLSFPHDRKVKIITVLKSLTETDLGTISFYTNEDFHLKPVFIGDPHPPVQLFWVYNNTHLEAVYCLDVVALRKSTSVGGVFDCVNPTGVVPPYSSTPLGFVFRPNEIITYSVYALLHISEDEIKIIKLTGEGIVKVSPTAQFAITKTIPRKTQIELHYSLECYKNTIDIPFLHVFSQSERHFYIKNRSETTTWAFRWHCYNIENMFNATVEPEEGVIKPSQDLFMTLTLKSYSYQTFLSFSIPCDITNYSELKAYEKSIKLRDKIMKREKDSFTITEKGMFYETQDIPVLEKPEISHIFLAVNANIVTNLNIDQNLIQNQQSILKAQNKIQNKMFLDFEIKPEILPSIKGTLEKIIWHILCSNSFANNLKDLQKCHNYNYSQLLSESKTKSKESMKRLLALPEKSFIQEFLASQITDVLCKNFIPDLNNE